MRSLFLVAAFFAFDISAHSQITNEKMNIVYRGVDNPMRFGFFGYSCKSVYVTVDMGELKLLEGNDNCGLALYSPPDTGRMAIFRAFAKTKKGSRKIWESKFRIKEIPSPEVYLADKRDGEIQINVLKLQQGLVAKIPSHLNMDICGNFRVDSFNYAIIRNAKIIATGKNISPYFDKNVKMYFSALEHNDTILFYNISSRGANGKSRKLESFELKAVK